jgi:signal transduction histidine kinase
MKTVTLIQTDQMANLFTQQVEFNRADLINRYRQSLQENLFTNRAEVHPRDLARIATEEADALPRAISHPLESGMERGVQLCQMGLSDQSVLALIRVTHQFILTIFESDQTPYALEIVDMYHNGVVQGFMKNREKLILDEQEQIRDALQIAVGRYTVEIKEVQSMAQKAIEANEFKSQFIARISHELRTPLGALMGIAEMLQQTVYGPLTDAQQDIIQRILNNAQTLKHVFSDFLDQSQIESGQLSLRQKPFSPKDLVNSVHSGYLAMALQKGLSMSVEIDSKLPEILMGDEGRVEQILTNLVVNAIKFTKTGGVSIHTFMQENEHWAIQVKDTGIGISQENWDHIFEPFRQVDETANRNYGGVGLGLSIVRQLANAMGGSITLESKMGQGSVFTVSLPFEPWIDRRMSDLAKKS